METYTLRIVVIDEKAFVGFLNSPAIPGARLEQIVNGDLFNDREAMSGYSKYVVQTSKKIMSFDEWYEEYQEKVMSEYQKSLLEKAVVNTQLPS